MDKFILKWAKDNISYLAKIYLNENPLEVNSVLYCSERVKNNIKITYFQPVDNKMKLTYTSVDFKVAVNLISKAKKRQILKQHI